MMKAIDATDPTVFAIFGGGDFTKAQTYKMLGQQCSGLENEWDKKPHLIFYLASAQDLNNTLTTYFDESQIFRIDHYLGKETVQNILAFRFANPLFEPLWNRHYIDFVAITVAEQVGVDHRGGYQGLLTMEKWTQWTFYFVFSLSIKSASSLGTI